MKFFRNNRKLILSLLVLVVVFGGVFFVIDFVLATNINNIWKPDSFGNWIDNDRFARVEQGTELPDGLTIDSNGWVRIENPDSLPVGWQSQDPAVGRSGDPFLVFPEGLRVKNKDLVASTGGEIKENGDVIILDTDPTGMGVVTYTNTESSTDSPSVIASFFGWILYYIASFFSYIVSLLIQALVGVATYNNFVRQPIVVTGWEVVRDVCNNFFIILVLLVAVGSIIRHKSFNYNMLPKILLMAILINFSKMITGIAIDFSQVLTLFFAQALTGVGSNIILFALGLHEIYQVAEQGGSFQDLNMTGPKLLWSLLMALVLSVVAAVVVCALFFVFIQRIVFLWFLIILSPAAFFASLIPQGSQFFGMWTSELTKYLLYGPLILFFLYLGFFSGSFDYDSSGEGGLINSGQTDSFNIEVETSDDPAGVINTGVSKKMNKEAFIDFGIVIGLLVGSLIMAEKVGRAGGIMAGKGTAMLTKWAKGGGRIGYKNTGKFVGRKVGRGTTGAIAGASNLKNKITGGSAGLVGSWAQDVNKSMDKKTKDSRMATLKKFGMGDKVKDYIAAKKEKQEAMRKIGKIPIGKTWSKAWRTVAGGAGGAAVGVGAAALAGAPLVLPALGTAALVSGVLGAIPGWFMNSKQTIEAAHDATKAKRETEAAGKRKADAINDKSGSTIAGKSKGVVELEEYYKGGGSFIGGGGVLSKQDKAMWDNIDAEGLKNINQYIAGLLGSSSGKDQEKGQKLKEAVNKALAAYKKNDGKTEGKNWATLKGHIDSMSTTNRTFDTTQIQQLIDDNKVSVASRATGKGELKQERGAMGVTTFAMNGQAEEGASDIRKKLMENLANTIRVDFRDIEDIMAEADIDFDVAQEGLHLPEDPELMKKVSERISSLIDDRLVQLEQNKDTISPEKFSESLEMLNRAKNRLADPEQIKSLNLHNSGLVDQAGAGQRRNREANKTDIHEQFHQFGIKDEDLTESLAEEVVAGSLYSMTPQIAEAVKSALDSGIKVEDIDVKAVVGRFKSSPMVRQRVDEIIDSEETEVGRSAETESQGGVNLNEQGQRVVAEVPELAELLEEFRQMKAVDEGSDEAVMAQAKLVEMASRLKAIEESLSGLGIDIGSRIAGFINPLSSGSSPLEIDVAVNQIQKILQQDLNQSENQE